MCREGALDGQSGVLGNNRHMAVFLYPNADLQAFCDLLKHLTVYDGCSLKMHNLLHNILLKIYNRNSFAGLDISN